MGKCGCFFPRDNFSRQIAQFRRSWSHGKMLAFQPRGFVFEPVCMRYFFTNIPKQKGSFYRHYETSPPRLFNFKTFENFQLSPKGVTPSILFSVSPFNFNFPPSAERMLKNVKCLIFCNRMDVKKFQRVPPFTVFVIVRFFNLFRLKMRVFSGPACFIRIFF